MSAIIERKESILACVLCCHDIDYTTRFDTVGVCGHKGVCSRCALRMRQLLGSNTCAICKAELPRVICLDNPHDTFDSFQDWGDNIGPSHVFDEPSGMFFVKEDYMKNIPNLRDPYCPKCGKKFATVASLKTHLLDVHHLQYCSICMEHKKVFLAELPVWTKDQLKKHSTKGNPQEGFAGHPRCDFCFSRYYTTAELYEHLHKNHFECDICLHSMNIQNRYYKNYHDLENHFRADHFLCEEPSCLAKKFVVFKSHIDLQGHLAVEHPHIKTSRKIDVHFTIRRPTRDGTSENENDGFEDYEQFRQQNNSNESGNVINVADFPSLSSGAQQMPSLFWENRITTGIRAEDFPALGPSASSTGGRAGSSFRNALAPPPTPAMMAHMNNNDPYAYPELSSAAAALGANNPLLRFVKPSKMKTKKGKKSGGGGYADSNTNASTASSRVAENESDDEEEKAPAEPEQSKSAIVLKIRQVLGSDAKYELFREDCKQFRMTETDIPSFYTKMRDLFSPQDFDQLFLKLMKLFPDKEQVDKFFTYHKQFTKQQKTSANGSGNGFQNASSKKNKQKQSAPSSKPRQQAPTHSGWGNALRESGISVGAKSRGKSPAVVVHNTNTRELLGRDEPPKTVWSSAESWQAPVATAAAAPSTGHTPATTKIQTAPIESFANMSVTRDVTTPSYLKPSTSAPTTFKSTKSDFPELPKAGRPVGVQAVTRATWDDQVQAIAQDRLKQSQEKPAGKKKQKKKSMTLGEMAMRFG